MHPARADRGGGGGTMLNIARLAAGSEGYYLNTIAHTVEDYYTGRGEAPGRWLGRQARELGLEGLVSADALRAVLAGVDPDSGEPLGSASNRRVPGFDLTFRPPKSVSLLWALGGREVSRTVSEAHDRAVEAAIGFLEDEVVVSRRGANGVETVEVDGVIAAGFRHRTSRADDPLLHTHVLVANTVRTCDDGQWRTLDSRRLYRSVKTVGFLYQAQLRAELTRELGVEWEPVVNGTADIAGIDRQVIEAFSTRRMQILARLDERGENSAAAAQVAALDTRTTKSGVDVHVLAEAWAQKAAELGLDDAAIDRLLGRRLDCRGVDVDTTLAELMSPGGLTANVSTFDRRDVLRAWAQAHPDGADISRLQELADHTLEHGLVIDLDNPDGTIRSLTEPPDDDGHRYTTPELLAVERRLIDGALQRLHAGVGVTPARVVERAVAARRLTGEQTAMVHQLCTSGAGVEVVVGKAGSGKTHALGAARLAWQTAGHRVIGATLAARAAHELEAGSGIASSTIHRLLADLDHPQHPPLPAGTVVVVDEAAMVGTRTLARLADHTARADAKLVLVGDHHQLAEIDAGGGFRALATRLPAIELTHNRRQHQPWERDALDQLRNGQPTDAVAAYLDHDRIHTADTRHELHQALVADWYATVSEHGTDAVMIAYRRADVADLNRQARTLLTRAGELTGPALQADGRTFQTGDRIMCLHNRADLGVVNGTRGLVTGIDPDRGSLTILTDRADTTVELPAAYLAAGHLDHAYATTAHKAQGLTCDHTFVLADDLLTREWAYVALSRGRQDNRLYLAPSHTHEHDPAAHPHTLEPEPGLTPDTLPGRLTRTRQQQLATDHLDRTETTRAVQRLRQHLAQRQQRDGLDRGIGL